MPKGKSKGVDAQKISSRGILNEVGKVLGVERILKNVMNAHPFKERLEKIDDEIKRRLRESPLSGTDRGRSSIVRGIPPRSSRPPLVRIGEYPKPEVEVFDEGDYLIAVASIPGVDEAGIDSILEGKSLTISFDRDGRSYKKTLALPSEGEGGVIRTYRNGILKLRINKKKS